MAGSGSARFQVSVGMRVADVEGHVAGHVGAVVPGAFRIDSDPLVTWVPEDLIFTAEDDRIELICTCTGIGKYALRAPDCCA